MDKRKVKSLFVEGPIPPTRLSDSIAHHEHKTNIGAHALFLGQVRADSIEDQVVSAISFTAHEDMANQIYSEIREEAFSKFEMTCAHVYHSLGIVQTGQLCFSVFTSSARRKMALEGCEFFVEQIKARVPIFGKEHFASGETQWKINS
ncbi:MAG: molybdenum cofactor biosynthesis protein MoaE [Bacteroidota bacterium]